MGRPHDLPGPDDGCFPLLGDHTDKRKILERVLVCPTGRTQRHHWGEVTPSWGRREGAVCLAKDRFRVRIEGWAGDVVVAAPGWERVSAGDCDARRSIAVWEPWGVRPRMTPYGPIPADSGHEETYWIEYLGTLTGGVPRGAGPFG